MDWTPEEIADLTQPSANFLARYPHRSAAAYRGKRQRVGLARKRTNLSREGSETLYGPHIASQSMSRSDDPDYSPKPVDTPPLRTVHAETEQLPLPPLSERLWAYLLKRRRKEQPSLADLADVFDVAPKLIRQALDELAAEHKNVVVNATGFVSVPSSAVPTAREVSIPAVGETLRFGVISDTHLVSSHHVPEALDAYYDECAHRGITTVLHAGDLTSGVGVYRGQENEILFSGYDRHVAHVIETYPKRDGITTHFIGGNHDEAWLKVAGADLCAAIAAEREDMKYLGMYNATVNVGPLRVTLHHGAKGAYTLSYHPQKIAESMTSRKNRPHLLVIGHYHSAIYLGPYVGIHTMTGGCWEGQSLYLKRMAIDPVIGGWFIEATVIDGEVRRLLPEFVSY